MAIAALSEQYRSRVIEEINALPNEYLPYALQLLRTFRESVALQPAESTFKQGWQEAQARQVRPVSELWDGIDAE